jgi:hypothetical protein
VSACVRVERHERHGLVAVKTTARPGDAERLTLEADLLAELDHPGLVERCELRFGDRAPELLTRWVPGGSLATRPAPSPARAAALVAGLAETVAGLHRRGLTHGRVDASHVLLDRRGHPILCGLGHARRIGPPTTSETTVGRLATGGRAADDVAALAHLLAELVGPSEARRWSPFVRSPRAGPRDRRLCRALLTLAARARHDDPANRPSAAALAVALRDLMGERTGGPDRTRPRRPRRLVALGAASGVLVVVLLAGDLAARRTVPPPRGAATPATSTIAPTTVARRPPVTAPNEAAPVVAHAGRRFVVGSPGDQVVVPGATCSGLPVAVVLRPSTGDVFGFDEWAEAGRELSVAPLANLGPGARLVEMPVAECRVDAVRHDGSVVAVAVSEER